MFKKSSVALVTGGASGIGRAIAMAFARHNCRVIISDLDRERGEVTAEALREFAQDAVFFHGDIADPSSVRDLHVAIMERFGQLDAACNNAGIEGRQAPTAESSLDNFDRVVGINLRGLYLCLREQLQIMEGQQSGAIVNMASVAGLVGFAGLSAYCASKGGVVQLTRTAAVEYAEKGIRVNAVCPGAIKTEMIDRITDRDPVVEKEFAALHPMNRLGTSEEAADAAVWLCSDQAGFITGQALAVDGGMVAR